MYHLLLQKKLSRYINNLFSKPSTYLILIRNGKLKVMIYYVSSFVLQFQCRTIRF